LVFMNQRLYFPVVCVKITGNPGRAKRQTGRLHCRFALSLDKMLVLLCWSIRTYDFSGRKHIEMGGDKL